MGLSFFNRMVRQHLVWISRVSVSSPRVVVSVFVILILLSLFSISKVRFETDIFRLFPAKKPALGLLLDSLEWSGGAREAYFLLEGERDTLPVEAERFAEKLRQITIDGKPGFNRVRYRVFEQSEADSFNRFIAFAAARPAAFVPRERVGELLDRMSPEGQDRALGKIPQILAGQLMGGSSALIQADPLSIRDFILPRLKSGSQALDLDPSSPFFLSRDGKVLIMIAEPARPVQDMAFARKLVAGINQARKGAAVPISCAGAHISAVIDEAAMKSNILACIISSLFVVLGIFYAVYRRVLPTLMIPVVLGVGVLLALGTFGLFSSDIHIISFAFMALIIGLGTDYSIHLYDRYHTERAAGLDPAQAVELAVTDTGHGLFTAAYTTALPFMALGFAEVRALSELGLLVGLGVLFSLYATLFFMPPILLFSDRYMKVYKPLPALFFDRIWEVSRRLKWYLMGFTVVSSALFLVLALGTSFDSELKNLQPRHSEAFRAQELVERHLNLAPRQILLALDGKDDRLLHERTIRLEKYVSGLKNEGRIEAWSSIGSIMNRLADQNLISNRLIQAGKDGAFSGYFGKALTKHGVTSEVFSQYINNLSDGFMQPAAEAEALGKLLDSPLRGVVDRHFVKDANGWHSLIYLYHNDGRVDPVAVAEDVRKIDPEARVSGPALVSIELLDVVKKSFVFGFWLGGLLVVMLLLSHFRDLSGIFAALGPVAYGSIAMLGVMTAFGMKLNFMNALVLVTIAGMGSDYGLHLIHRISGKGAAMAAGEYVQSSRAVFLSAVTTIAGFGSLAFTDYAAMSSIGWATNLGISFTALAALIILPAAVHASKAKRGES